MTFRPATWGPQLALALAAIAGAAVRISVLKSPIGRLDGDEGVTGVMAQRILDGHFPAFFGVQNYQGSLEQYLQAGVLAVLPDSPLTLRLVQIALAVVAIVLTYLLASRVSGSRWGGALAAWLLALGPYYLVVKGVRSHGGYDTAVVAGLAMILLALALRRSSARARWTALAMGLAGGLAVWANPTAAYMVIPATVWALGSAHGSMRRLLPAGLLGAIIGLLPWIVHALITRSLTPSRSEEQPITSYLGRLGSLADPVLPDFLGLSNANPALDPRLPARAIAIALVLVVVWAIWRRRRGLLALVTLRQDGRQPLDLVLLALIITPFLYAASPFTWFDGEPRYLFTLYPLVAAAAAAGAMAIRVPQIRMAMAVTMVIGSAFLLGASLDASMRADGSPNASTTGRFYSEDLPTVVDVLREQGVTAAYGGFWLAGPLQFTSGNSIAVAAGLWTQFPDIERQVAQTPNPALVVPTDPGASLAKRVLGASGRQYTAIPAGRFTVFVDITPPWRPVPQSLLLSPG